MRTVIKVSLSLLALGFSSSAFAQSGLICTTEVLNKVALDSRGRLHTGPAGFASDGADFQLSDLTPVDPNNLCQVDKAAATMRRICTEFLAGPPVSIHPVIDNGEAASCGIEQGAISKLSKEVTKLRKKLRQERRHNSR